MDSTFPQWTAHVRDGRLMAIVEWHPAGELNQLNALMQMSIPWHIKGSKSSCKAQLWFLVAEIDQASASQSEGVCMRPMGHSARVIVKATAGEKKRGG